MKDKILGCKGKDRRCLKTGICEKSGEPVVYDEGVLICPYAIIKIEGGLVRADSQVKSRFNPNDPYPNAG